MLNLEKQKYIDELNQRVEDKILNKANADFLIKLIDKANSLEDVQAIMAMGTTYKRTGFHFDFRKEPNCSNIKYLKRNNELSFEANKNALTHKLIIGDNYDALKQLSITHRGRIDIIYIDPPYGKDDMGKFAHTNYSNAITRDNLLSMLYTRLQLAYDLLKDFGVIYCSIDDNNQAYIKCLFDDIFGEKNFYGTFIQLKGNTQNDSKQIQKNHEYILCYVKNYQKNLVLSYDNWVKKKVKEDNYTTIKDGSLSDISTNSISKENTIYYMEGTGNGETGNNNRLIDRKNLGYTIYYMEHTISDSSEINKLMENVKMLKDKYGDFDCYVSKDGKKFLHAIAFEDYKKDSVELNSKEENIYTDITELINLGYTKIRPPKRKGNVLGCWTWELETFQEYWNNNEILIKKGTKKINIIRKFYLKEEDLTVMDGKKYYLKHNILPLQSVININNSDGTTLLSGDDGIIPGCPFSNPKNPEMLKFLFKAYDNKNAVILDFFAGSGSTGHAVLDLNKDDGDEGKRQFILCTNNEITDKTPTGIAYDVTTKRLKRIMTGECYNGTNDFGWIKDHKPYGDNLEVTEIAEISSTESDKYNTPFDIIDEKLYGVLQFENKEDKIDWICTYFEGTMKDIESDTKYCERWGE
ncbi:DNA methyltransferase [Clostridium perfringens]